MKKPSSFLHRLSDKVPLMTDVDPLLPIAELAGFGRLLIENHRGVCLYTPQSIEVAVRHGCLRVGGEGLNLTYMTYSRLLIRGYIHEITILRRGAAGWED